MSAHDRFQESVATGVTVRDLPAAGVQSHAANLMPLANGDLGCVWFGGTQEGLSDISIWFSRLAPDAVAWSTPMRLSDDPDRSEQNPILFPAPDSTLWLLHTAQRSGHQDTAIVRRRVSTDDGHSWSAPDILVDTAGTFVRQPLVVRPDGRWLLPIFHCRALPGERWSGDDDDSSVLVSEDQGQHWASVRVPDSRGCVHMNIVPGRTAADPLLAFYRSRWADHVWRSTSHDGGSTWSAPQPTPLPNNNSSIQVTRLKSGRLAIVFNDISAAQATERRISLYDEIEDQGDAPLPAPAAGGHEDRRRAYWGTPRAPMSIALSGDEGLSWPFQRDIETGDGYCMTNNSAEQRNRELSYPSVTQSADGRLHVAYTRHRQHIRHVELDEDWVMAGPASPTSTR